MFVVPVCEVASECSESVPGTEVRLMIMKSRYMMRGYVSRMMEVELEKVFSRVPVTYGRRLQTVFATHIFDSAVDKKNSLVLVCSGGKRSVSLWVVDVLLLSRIGFK